MRPEARLLTLLPSGYALLGGLLCGGCAAPPDERIGTATAAITVDEAVTAGCSTSQIAALSMQIIAQSNCIEPGAFSELSQTPDTNFGSAVLPYLEEPARDRLAEALAENPGMPMQVNSMLRTVAQQYLLYQWFLAGTCGISLAASPSTSNHETGLAIDIQQYDSWRTILEAKDFSWLGGSDPVHFDYAGPGAIDHRDLGVLAFQQLWNLNNATDLITEDGIYGPETETRIQMAPSEGFAEGPTCGTPGEGELNIVASFMDATDRFVDGPSAGVIDLFEGSTYLLTVEVSNIGATAAAGVSLELGDHAALSFDTNVFDLGDIAPNASAIRTVEVTADDYNLEPAPSSIALSAAGAAADVPVDVYSQTQWAWDTPRLEGWSAIGNGAASVMQGSLSISAGSSATSPTLTVAATSVPGIVVEGSGTGAILVVTDDGERVFDLDLTSGRADITLTNTAGTLIGLRVDATTDVALSALRFEVADSAMNPTDGAEDGCGCELPGTPSRSSDWVWIAVLGCAFTHRNRSRATVKDWA